MTAMNLQQTGWRVTQPEAAQALLNHRQRRFLQPFVGRECSAQQAATELGVKLNTLLYHVKRLLYLGLLRVTREVPRRGKPIKVYRSVADQFFIPFELSRADTLQTLLSDVEQDARRRLLDSLIRAAEGVAHDWGFRVYRQSEDVIALEMVPAAEQNVVLSALVLGPDAPAMWANSQRLRLLFPAAKALQRELNALLERYYAQQVAGAQEYLLQLNLTPVKPESAPYTSVP